MFNKVKDSLKKIIRDELQTVLKANPVAAFTFNPGEANRPIPLPSDPDAIAKATSIDIWAYVAINTIGKNLSEAPLIAEQSIVVDGELQWKPLETGRLYELIQRPNEYESTDALLWRLTMSLMTGDAYLIQDPDTQNLYHVPVGLTRIVVNEDGISHYEITKNGKILRVEVDDIVHFTMPSPLHEYYGLSPIEPVKNQLLINHYYNRHIKNFFKSGAIPQGVLTTDQGVDETVAAQTRQEWNRTYGGEGNMNTLAVLGQGLKYETITPPLKDLVIETLNTMPRDAILAAFGLPPVMAGVYEYANYANSKEQIKIFWQNTTMPIQRIIATGLNHKVSPKYGDNVRLRFDTSKITALQEDELARSTRLTTYVRGGIITPNEARKQLGLDNIDGGDELRAGQTGFSLADFGGNKALHFSAKAEPRIIRLDNHIKQLTRDEKTIESFMRSFFDGQANRVIDELRGISTTSRRIVTSLLYAKMQNKGDDGDVFDLNAENILLRSTIEPIISDIVNTAGEAAAVGLSIDFVFNLQDPEVVRMINNRTNRIVGVNQTTYEMVQQILTEVYEQGLGINEAVNLLTDQFAEFSKTRARTIAITETNGAVSGTHQLAWTDMGISRKLWITAPALHPRHELIPGLDGQIVNMNERFDVGGEMLMFPGDPDGSPGNIIHCHCAMAPVDE